PRLREFAAAHDLTLFVSGTKSSNGKILYGECKDVNERTYLISNPDEINPGWLDGISSVGICGATSTPRWLMEDVRDYVTKLCENNG
ncbi:MAG: 4-hydroxy-3-methylbut-2-enyl diphosphate reductase, partial [Muribaculum sp.]|nr:4-hydroxy-3-methylbut-2-enyl diphosphate reductase [Muribaculum sp.]